MGRQPRCLSYVNGRDGPSERDRVVRIGLEPVAAGDLRAHPLLPRPDALAAEASLRPLGSPRTRAGPSRYSGTTPGTASVPVSVTGGTTITVTSFPPNSSVERIKLEPGAVPQKVMSGVRKACQGRPVTEGDLAVLAQQVEESVRQTGSSQVDTNEIGLAILGPLRELDEVAYLRFASVYQAFDSLEDFESAIGQLRADHPLADAEDAIAAES